LGTQDGWLKLTFEKHVLSAGLLSRYVPPPGTESRPRSEETLRITAVNGINEEHEAYRKVLPQLSREYGRYVLISGREVVATFESLDDAVEQASTSIGVRRPFLVKRIVETY
jgi:hypothetical protein